MELFALKGLLVTFPTIRATSLGYTPGNARTRRSKSICGDCSSAAAAHTRTSGVKSSSFIRPLEAECHQLDCSAMNSDRDAPSSRSLQELQRTDSRAIVIAECLIS